MNENLYWWTWAGFRANATLTATLDDLVDPAQSYDDIRIRLRADLTREQWLAGVADAVERICLPDIDDKALAGLKFSIALPTRLAVATLAARLAEVDFAATVLREPARFTSLG
ncbi:hypothetical protein ACFQY4_26425 [Catellatospora bangladeshensis]|uniref:hypothetical protein n=1 Tax=Catellatospora bangladeshensis TaxID=310355 RepID=UPI0036233F65